MRLIRRASIVVFALAILHLPATNAVAEGEPDGTWKPPPIGTKVAYNYGAKYEIIRTEGSKVFVKGRRSSETQEMAWYIYKGTFHSR